MPARFQQVEVSLIAERCATNRFGSLLRNRKVSIRRHDHLISLTILTALCGVSLVIAAMALIGHKTLEKRLLQDSGQKLQQAQTKLTSNENVSLNLQLNKLMAETLLGQMVNQQLNNQSHRINANLMSINQLKVAVQTFNVSVNDNLVKLSGWKRSGNFVYQYFAEALSYSVAKSRCRGYQGRLAAAVLRDPTVVRTIISHGYVGTQRSAANPWIGFDDVGSEGIWRWSDGGSSSIRFVKWDRGQPDDNSNEDCAQIWRIEGGSLILNDIQCALKYHYLCEIQLS